MLTMNHAYSAGARVFATIAKKLLWEAQYLKLPTASTMVQVTIEFGRNK